MGLRFYKRINLGKGFGLNISKSGIKPSYRSKRGSISSRGFTLRTGIPGLNYRKNFSQSSKGGCVLTLLIALTMGMALTFSACSIDDIEEFEELNCGTHNGHQLYVGPRGGCYYYNSSGNKEYVPRSECNC